MKLFQIHKVQKVGVFSNYLNFKTNYDIIYKKSGITISVITKIGD